MNTAAKSSLVYQIDKVYLITEATGAYVLAFGTANSSATRARLVRGEGLIPETLYLDLVAHHESATVMTPVSARGQFELDGKNTIVVRGQTNEVSIPIPQPQKKAATAQPGELAHRWWSALHFVVGNAIIPVLEGTRLTAYFDAQGTVFGSGGCNEYGAECTILLRDPPGISITGLAHTKMWCEAPAGIMEQEAAFFDSLRAATDFDVEGGVLTLRRGKNAVVFDLRKPAKS
jgi:heat shock protein HslJ